MPTSQDPDRITRLEQQVLEIDRRVAELEARRPATPMTKPGTTGLPAHLAGNGNEDGAVLTYSGEGRFGQYQLRIGARATLSAVLDADPDVLAQAFTALASPVRITLLRAMVGGPRNSQQLRDLVDVGSVGQLYHHLRELLAAGLIAQPARSVYAIPQDKVVAICVALTAATHLNPAALKVALPPEVPEEEEAPGDHDKP